MSSACCSGSCDVLSPLAPPPPALSMGQRWILGASGTSAALAEVGAWSGMAEDSPWIISLALFTIVVGGYKTIQRGWQAVRLFSLDIHFLMSLAVVGAMILGQWPEAAMVIFLFAVAEWIETLSLDKARHAVRELLSLAPEEITIRNQQGEWQTIPSAVAQVGAVALLKPGERIALDGTVLEGRSAVNQAPITGESMPVMKEVGDTLFAGSINGTGTLEFRITSDAGHSTLARMVATIQEAQAKRAPMQRFVESFAHYYTPAVVIIAILLALLPPLLFQTPLNESIYNALVMLVVSCPCALVISTPVTVVSGLAAGARQGILIKGGLYLEQAHHLRAIALDKTGTLTQGRLELCDVILLGQQERERVLRLAASLEAHSEHPVATAIRAAWPANRLLLHVREFEALAGRGAKGVLAGEIYHIGNQRLLTELGLNSPEIEEMIRPLEEDEKTVVILTSPREPLAIFAVTDKLRDNAPSAVASLHGLGISTLMLTGDNPATAHAIARHTGIHQVQANLLPVEKWQAIEELTHRYQKVAMVGDGINDAAALAGATIGIAMGGSGTDAAMETADVVIMNDDLTKLVSFIQLGHATHRILWQNIGLAIGIKGFFLCLAALGMASLWMAVVADLGTSLLVIVNGRRLLKEGKTQFKGQLP
ncbi:MAG: heavy metal translocating P-type ATPase [Magnetococcales bacterium]|nr:heavy metal translocating P-type ATPase [Magnetococcales bacterium]NGZ27584.1 heavy metal translocating P-type ATPase [Magnetococcales bacterium]